VPAVVGVNVKTELEYEKGAVLSVTLKTSDVAVFVAVNVREPQYVYPSFEP
jgi:hypothetical protein